MSSAKKLINDPNNVVAELIEGMVETYPNLQYLDGFPEVKVVLRADVCKATYDKVAVISGGGSGHEPAHVGYVGVGMLTAAVCGDVFTSPSVTAVLAALRAVTGPPGCLLVVKNYAEDRLNFGLAAEQAKAEGFKVDMVIVGDDCALPPPRGAAGRRGLAGIVLVHKVAGSAADAGLNLAEVTAEARKVAEVVGTMGVSLSMCAIPGQVASNRLESGKMELGLGICCEHGAAVVDIQPVDTVVMHVLRQILSMETQYVPIKRGSRVALMVNGLGATPLMELMIAAGKAVAQLQLDFGLAVERVYTGNFMTSLDMAGFSLSILKVDDSILSRLDSRTKAPAWPVGVDGPRPQTTIPVPVPRVPSALSMIPCRPQELSFEGHILETAIQAGAQAILNLKESLNEWDTKVGDGDCGTTMCKGATAILEDLEKHYPVNDAVATVNELGISMRRVMGGTSGVIYDILCKAAYAWLKENSSAVPSANDWAGALDAAVAAVGKYGGASAGYRTLLDALIPAASRLQERLKLGENGASAFLAASEAAGIGAESTKSMQAQAGRSSYLPAETLMNVPDPGAMAAAAWFSSAAAAVVAYHKVS